VTELPDAANGGSAEASFGAPNTSICATAVLDLEGKMRHFDEFGHEKEGKMTESFGRTFGKELICTFGLAPR
jgi:hypothetical protein